MASLARFTFDLDLGQRPTAPPPVMPEDLVAQLVRQAREDGYAQGLRDGEGNATTMAAQTIASAAAALATSIVSMTAALDDARKANRVEAVNLAAAVGRKLAAHLVARYPVAEIEALIAECMASLDGVPHLVIRCHPDIADAVRDVATDHMTTSGFSGRLIVMGDPDQRLGDGRLEWVDGGLVRDINTISREIDQRISAYLATRGIGPQEEKEA
ncbi:FliH/SctL family protein [Devosia geojensis]|uniref:FliH/SctL family protein n=1 Tax=Devosia geojensis TaxID=443610 RepID=UPI0006982C68|nr:FliH/SctL family protein [Devosia geojensis]